MLLSPFYSDFLDDRGTMVFDRPSATAVGAAQPQRNWTAARMSSVSPCVAICEAASAQRARSPRCAPSPGTASCRHRLLASQSARLQVHSVLAARGALLHRALQVSTAEPRNDAGGNDANDASLEATTLEIAFGTEETVRTDRGRLLMPVRQCGCPWTVADFLQQMVLPGSFIRSAQPYDVAWPAAGPALWTLARAGQNTAAPVYCGAGRP
jgi:hypothetical protein